MRIHHLLSLFCLLFFVQSVSAQTVSEYKLENGMRVIVKEDHRSPVAISMVWYGIGSGYEYLGITGISHVLEHMMFKGTHRYPAGEFSSIIAENGGQENAFTSYDYTAYYQYLASDRLETAIRLEADRMRNLTLPEEEFLKEIEVVKEERRLRTEDNPNALTYEHFMATAWMNSPYQNPIIGWMSDLDAMKVEDLRKWYQQWYSPNNAILVVAGDVDPDKVYKMARRYFGQFKAEEIVPPKAVREVEQRGERRITVKAPAELPYLIMGYKAPVAGQADEDWEPYALLVLATVMAGSETSVLQKELVRGSEMASAIDADYRAHSRLPLLLTIDAIPTAGTSIEDLESAINKQVEKLKKDLVDTDKLDRIKAGVVASEIYQRDSVQHQAIIIGMMETLGYGWKAMDEYVDKIKAVTPEQVRAVAQKYLVSDQRTVAILDPQPIDPDNPPSDFSGHLR